MFGYVIITLGFILEGGGGDISIFGDSYVQGWLGLGG